MSPLMKHLLITTVVGALAISGAAHAQDPYAHQMAVSERQKLDQWTELTAREAWGYHCKVINGVGVSAAAGVLQDFIFGTDPPSYVYSPRSEWPSLQAALDRGSEMYEANGCEFWKTHPSAVMSLRQMAAARINHVF